MKQVLHDFRSGKVVVTDVPRPALQANSICFAKIGGAYEAERNRQRGYYLLCYKVRRGVKAALKATGRTLSFTNVCQIGV